MSAAARNRRWARTRPVVTAGISLAVIALVALWFATRPAPPKGTEYDVVAVTRSTQTQTVALSGTIYARDQSNATFKVPGTITGVFVKVGDKVARGTPLAAIETRDLSDAVAIADANAAAARAQLRSVQDSGRATAAQLQAARAQVRSAEASLTNARNRLMDATLTSPIEGVVARVDYEVGDQVTGTSGAAPVGAASGGDLAGFGGLQWPTGTSASSAAGSIVVISPGAWKLDASVGTADLPSLKQGQAAMVTPTGTSTQVTGVVDTVGIIASPNAGATATFPVSIAITDAGAGLFAGSSADAVVTVGTFPDVVTMPVAGVVTADGRSTVRLLRDGAGVPTEVTLGRRFGSQVEILAGLSVGDQIQVPHALVITQPTQPLYGPNGRLASPTTGATR